MKYDHTIAIQALEDDNTLYLQYNKFPMKEEMFMQYFHVHLIPKCPMYCNQITIGCCILSTKTIPDIKRQPLTLQQ